ncbi:MAG: 23S rRNA (uracil(1939)-C(5))-methyltransferase RlmD [Firmicutes bacterium]|nr:23S rRNA (uracil(1939)-C(5))-methyltransferase RlmD [Bacillota bacterium]
MTVTITDISSDGKGIGRTEEGRVVFVPGVVPGDIAEIELTEAPAAKGRKTPKPQVRLLSVVRPSADRVAPPCMYFSECGGCQLMCLSYGAQLRIMQKHVEAALERIGGFKAGKDYILKDILHTAKPGKDGEPEMPLRYRNKAEFALEGNRMGYYRRGTHELLEIDDCLIQNAAAVQAARQKCSGLKETQKYFKRIIARSNKEGDIMLITENSDGTFTSDHRILHDEILTQARTLKTEVSPLSFYQVNPEGCSLLYSKVQEYASLTGSETLLDLYCGAGSIGLSMAAQCSRVIGVESVKPAVIDANRNAVINGIVNATFICGKAEEVIDTKLQGVKADVVVVDPPRAGCAKSLLEAIKRIAPKRLVYVSCDPATLARDLKILCAPDEDSGTSFHLIEATPVSMFPGTLHVETVCCLYHQKKDYISVPYEPKDAEYLK